MVDGRQGDRIANYTKFWNKDISKEESADTDNRVDSYTDVVNGMPTHFSFAKRLSHCNFYQDIMTGRRNFTSTDGPNPSTSAAFTKAKHLPLPLRVTSITSPHRWDCGLGCGCSMLGAVWADPRAQ